MSWPEKQIADVCIVNPRRAEALRSLSNSHPVTFVPMPAVDACLGKIVGGEIKLFGSVRKGFTYFEEGDVIFAKITPCMQNGKCAIATSLENHLGFGSTEFHVIRPDTSKILPEWVWHFLRQESYKREAACHLRGAVGQQRIPSDFIERSKIPLPRVEEQRRIVARIKECMERVEETEKLHAEIDQRRGALLESVIESELQTAKGATCKLAQVCEIRSTLVNPSRPEFLTAIHIGGANIESGSGVLKNLRTSQEENLKSGKFPFSSEMVLYNKIRPYLKKVAKPEFEGICSADMYPLLPDQSKILKNYLFYLLLSKDFTHYAIAGSNRAGMPKVNREHLFNYEFKLPKLEDQKAICTKLDEAFDTILLLKTEFEEQAQNQSHLRDAILRKAFSGQL